MAALQPAADDALLYGFCLPAGLGVMLWIFARSSQTPLRGAIVPVVAANLWHLGVLVGLVGHFDWRQHRVSRGSNFRAAVRCRFSSPILLLALWAMMIFAGRRERGAVSVALVFARRAVLVPVDLFDGQSVPGRLAGARRGAGRHWLVVCQQSAFRLDRRLSGLGTAFYFLPKFAGRPLQSHYLALFAFWTLILFGTWCGIPQGAPVPAWMPTLSAVAAAVADCAVARHCALSRGRRCGAR